VRAFWLMLLLAPLALPGQAQILGNGAARYNTCLKLAAEYPQRAIAYANNWRIDGGGGSAARHCLALAQYHNHDISTALATFEAAATESERAGDGLAVQLWRQAADAATLSDRPEPAVRYLARAIDLASVTGPAKLVPGLRVERAEALVALDRAAEARAELDRALAADPDVEDGWLLSATLSRRMGDLSRAEAAILEAAKRAPDSAAVQYEAGTIAAAGGKTELARTAWTAAAAAEPESIPGKAAAKALAALPAATAPAAKP
jgi:tetratricopeptide (TPR) repeat protein